MAAKPRRPPQLALRLEAETPDLAARWRDGAPLTYLGSAVTLRLDTACKEALLDGSDLHLPLPPEATPRQVQDAAESWQRASALRVIAAQAVMAARGLGREEPNVTLSFSTKVNWAQMVDRGLRFHWRLIEQPPEIIAHVVERAVAGLPRAEVSLDLFALA
jgi:predicted metal-dependent hydrolase